MNKFKSFQILITLCLLVLLGLLFMPRNYDVVGFKERKGTQYWTLKTGSKIGYFKLGSIKQHRKTPIIYLHGGPGGKITNQIIESLRPLISIGHDLYFYDQIGSGHSDRLEDIKEYTVERHRKDLKEIISIIGSDQIILLGHSWGAVLAINYLQNDPHTIEKLILTGPGPILPINSNVFNEIPPEHYSLKQPSFTNKQGNKEANNLRSRLMAKWASTLKTKLASDEEADQFFTHLCKELSKSTDCTVDESRIVEGGGGYYSHLMTFNSLGNVVEKRDILKELKTPILLLRGQCDNQKWGFAKEYLDLFVNSDLKIIEGAGHNIINSARKEYIELIYDFLKEKQNE